MNRFGTENLPLKIISIVVGLVMYLFVMQEKEDERQFPVPVRVETQPEGYVLLTEIPVLRVVVSGPARQLARVQSDELEELVVRLDEPQPIITFSALDFDLPAGVEIRSIFPESVQLSYAQLATRDVPILVNIRGRPHRDYSVVDIRVTPDRIRVRGPEEEVEELTGIFTAPIDIYDRDTEDLVREHVELLPFGSYMSYDRSVNITVRIDIEPNEEVSLQRIRVALEGPTECCALEGDPLELNVWLVGPPTLIGSASLPIRATVDTRPYTDAEPGRYLVAPRILDLPAAVRVDRMQPETIPLIVTPSPRAEFIAIPVPVPGILPMPLPPLVTTPQ